MIASTQQLSVPEIVADLEIHSPVGYSLRAAPGL